MDDSKIIDLYWRRDERAIEETDSKYGAYCRAVSMNIIGVREDAEECVNDTYARAWNAMPPERPACGHHAKSLHRPLAQRTHAWARQHGDGAAQRA